MAPKPRKKPGADVQLDDPTDFHAPSLRALDHSLRCSLCQELFTAPVLLTPCSHSFDSLCVREHLAETKRCPVCHVEANEDKIKPVHQLEEAVRLWKAARTDILALQAAALSRPSPAAGPSSSSSSPTPIAGPSRSTSTSNSTTFPVSFKPLPSSDRKGKRKAVDPPNGKVKRKGKEVEVEELTLADSDDEDDDVVIEGGSPPRKKSKNGKGKERAKTPKKEEVDSAEGGDPEDPNLIVSCPICSSLVKNAHIATHIDSGCKKGRIKPDSVQADKGGGGSAWNKLLSSGGGAGRGPGGEKGKGTPISESEIDNEMDTTQPLPLKNYTGKTLRDLTKMLTDYHLPLTLPSSTPSSASLSTYTTRHQHFTRLWNANADIPRSSPAHKTARELRAELEAWEKGRERARREEEGKKKKEVGEKETNQQWLELIAQARESALKMREQQKAAATAPVAQPDEDIAMVDAGAASSVTVAAADEPADPPPPPQPESAAAKSPSPAPPRPPPPAATRKRSVRILSPVRSSPPAPTPPTGDDHPPSFPKHRREPPSRSPSFSPPSFLRDDDSLAFADDAEEDDLRSLLGEKQEWAASEKQKEKQRVREKREKREEGRELSPFNPEPPRPSQRNREEERMFAELAAEREANGLAEDEEDEEE